MESHGKKNQGNNYHDCASTIIKSDPGCHDIFPSNAFDH